MDVDIPDEHTKGLFVTHIHQQRADQKAKSLTISNLFVVQAVALQHARKHFLPITVGISKHGNTRKTSPYVLVDDRLVRARFAGQLVELLFNRHVSRTCHADPDDSAEGSWNAGPDLIRCKCWQPLRCITVVLHEGGPQIQFGHWRRSWQE